MARNLTLRFIRTTRANLNTQAAASGLFQGEIYTITDESGKVAVATSTSAYSTCNMTNLGTSGATLGLLSTANTYTLRQTFSAGFTSTGGMLEAGNYVCRFEGTGASGYPSGATGKGVGFYVSAGTGLMEAYDITAAAYFPFMFKASTISFRPAGTEALSINGALGNYANDAAAATGGVPVNGMYRNGSILMVRVT